MFITLYSLHKVILYSFFLFTAELEIKDIHETLNDTEFH